MLPESTHAFFLEVTGWKFGAVPRVEHWVSQVHDPFSVARQPALKVNYHQSPIGDLVREVRQGSCDLDTPLVLDFGRHEAEVVGQFFKAALKERLHVDPVEDLVVDVDKSEMCRGQELDLNGW